MSQSSRFNGQGRRINFFVHNPDLLADGKTIDSLGVNQLGFIDTTQTPYVATTLPSARVQKLAIYQGSKIETDQFSLELLKRAGLPNEHRKAPYEINTRKINKFYGTAPNKHRRTSSVALGFDGIDTNKKFHVNMGEHRVFYVHLHGAPIDYISGQMNHTITREYSIKGDCLPSGCLDSSSEKAQEAIVNDLMQQIQNDKYHFGRLPMSKLIRAGILKSCVVSDPSGQRTYYKWRLSVVDLGNDDALGMVQKQYPNYRIKRIGRAGLTSIYETTQQDSVISIADFSADSIKLLAECKVCPTGYTKSPALQVYEVIVPNGVTPASVAGEVSRVRLAIDQTSEKYLIYFPENANSTTVISGLSTTANIFVTYNGLTTDVCTPNAAVLTASWVKDTTAYLSRPKDYKLTLMNPDCGLATNYLADLQAAYPNDVVSIDTTGTCVNVYKLTRYSTLGTKGCDESLFQWKAPHAYRGLHNWQEVPVVSSIPDGCSMGIVIEGAALTYDMDSQSLATLGYYALDKRLRYPISVRISSKESFGERSPCQIATPVTVLSTPKTDQLLGSDLIELEKESMYFLTNFPWDSRAHMRKHQKNELTVQLDKYYYEYVIGWLDTTYNKKHGFPEEELLEIHFFVVEGAHKNLEKALNALVLNNVTNTDLKPVTL